METHTSTLHFDASQNAVIDRSDGSILPLDVLGSGIDALPAHIQAQIQCKRDEDYARSLSEGPGGGSKRVPQGDYYSPLDIDIEDQQQGQVRPPLPSLDHIVGGYLSPTHQSEAAAGGRGGGREVKSLEQEYLDMHELYPAGGGGAGAGGAGAEDEAPDWSLARALQGLEFEMVQVCQFHNTEQARVCIFY
jgi:hypothetical protein